MSSLVEYHSNTYENIQIRQLLDQAEILIDKKLFKVAKSVLLKAEKLALEHEHYFSLFEICSRRYFVVYATANQADLEYIMKEQILSEKRYLDHLKNRIEYKDLGDIIHYLHNESDKNHPGFQEVRNSPLLISPKIELTFSVRKHYYNVHVQAWYLLRKEFDINMALRKQEEWITYLESDKQRLVQLSDTYLAELSNLMLIQSRTEDNKKCDDLLNKANLFFNSLPSKKKTKTAELRMFGLTINYMISPLRSGNPKKSIEAGEGILPFATNENPAKVLLWENLFYAYFLLPDYREALKYLNRIINYKEKYRPDVQAMARIFLLLIHYELGHLELLPFLVKQVTRFLVKHNYFLGLEKIMLRFFEKNIYQYTDTKEQISVYSNLKQQLETLFKDPRYANYPEDFGFISWIESKIQKRSFLEIVRGKVKPKIAHETE